MLRNVKKLLSKFGNTRADRFAAAIAALRHESPILNMQGVAEWLGRDTTNEQLQQDGLVLLCAADDTLRQVTQQAMGELVAAATNHARTALLLRAMLPFLRAIRDHYHDALQREIVQVAQKSARQSLVPQAVANWLYWLGRDYIAHFLIEPKATRLPWFEIRPTIMFALGLDGRHGNITSDGDDQISALQKQTARLVLLSRSISVDMQGRQLLIADRIADNLADYTRISTKHTQATPFGHANQGDNPPTVLSQLPTRGEQRAVGLYYGLEPSLQALEGLEYQIKLHNALPEMLNPDGALGVAEALVVIKHLKNRWSGNKVERRAERRAIAGNVSVAYEFDTVRRQVQYAHTPPTGLKPIERHIEPGQIADASLNGLGVKLTKHMGWLKVGQMLGIRIDSDPHWRIGMVRRAAQSGQREMLAGVQLLGRNPEATQLVAKGSMTHLGLTAVAGETGFPAIYLQPTPHGEPHHLVICPSALLETGRTYRAALMRGQADIHIVDVEDIGSDCVIYRGQLVSEPALVPADG